MQVLNAIKVLAIFMMLSCSKKGIDNTSVTPPANTRTVHVSTTAELKYALLNAEAGDDIILSDGTYNGKFVVNADIAGTSSKRIMLRGSRNAILDGGSITTGYVLYLQANYWTVKGITITNGLKGIMADGVNYTTIDSVKVDHIGEEGIHLRKNSSHNTIQYSEITNTGLTTPDYGEGVYVGSAKSNWDTYTNGNPDLCDSNLVQGNHIGPGITAECIDIKEGTTAGIIRGNFFDATGITGANSADSWMDVKGNYYLVDNNFGFNPTGSVLKDGFQVNVASAGWGNYNEFKNNQCTVNAVGYGFLIKLTSSSGTAVGNKVYVSNQVTGAASGVSNIALSN
jgi:hypothetical protein